MPKGRQRKLPKEIEEAAVKVKRCFALKLVLMTVRVHPFPFRTRKLSSLVPTILGWKRPGTIGRCQHKYSSIAQPVEHATVNRRVVGSSPTWGARKAPDATHPGLLSYRFDSGPLHHLFSAANGAAGRTGKRKERFEGAMQTKGTVQKGIFLVVAVLFLLSLIPVFAMAFYAYPSADDLTYGVSTARAWQENHSLSSVVSAAWEGTMEKYQTWQGSFFAVLLMHLQPAVFGTSVIPSGASAPDWVSYLWSSASLYNFPAALFLCPSAGRHYHTRAPFPVSFFHI